MERLVTRLFKSYIGIKPDVVHLRKYPTVDLAYHKYGSGNLPPIIVLHGLFGSKRNWRSTAERLNENLKMPVIAVDLRNHGDSPFHGAHNYNDLAKDVTQLMQKLRLNEATIIGHSMGGRTAMTLALTEPAKVTSLIVVDISPASSPNDLTGYMPQLMDVMLSVDFSGKALTQAKEDAKSKLNSSELIHPGLLNFLLLNVEERNGKVGWRFNLEVLRRHIDDITTFPPKLSGKVYQGPTLFVAGGDSAYVPKSDTPAIKRMFPQVGIVYIENAGHNPFADNPQMFLDVVTKFISEYSLK